LAETRLYVRIRGRVTGPFDLEQLQRFRVRGQLLPAHDVSAAAVPLSPASTVAGLFSDAFKEQAGTLGQAAGGSIPPPPPLPPAASTPVGGEVQGPEDVAVPRPRWWAGARWPRFSPPAWALLAATGTMVLLSIIALIAAGRYAALQAKLGIEADNREREFEQRDIRLAQREIDIEERQRQLDRRDSQLTQLEQQLDQKQRALVEGEKKLALGQQEVASRNRDLDRQELDNQARRARLDKDEQDLGRRRQELEDSRKKPVAAEKPPEPADKKKEVEPPALDADSKAEAQKLLRQVRRLVNEYRLNREQGKRLDIMELCREVKVRFPNTEYARQAEGFRKQVLEIDRE
jgi:hypothetical protein